MANLGVRLAPFRKTAPTRRFWKHAKRHTTRRHQVGPMILMEAFQPASSVVALSVFATQLADATCSKIVGYHQVRGSLVDRIKAKIRYRATGSPSFGARGLLMAMASRSQRSRAMALLGKLNLESLDPHGLEQIEVLGVKVGDLAYDLYLQRTGLPTVDFADPRLADTVLECIEYGVFWSDYFLRKQVTAVCVSHCVYQHGIPARFALAAGVRAYQVNIESLYLVTRDFPHAYTDFFGYPREFQLLNAETQVDGLKLARTRLQRRFSGEIGVDMPYSSASAYSGTSPGEPVLRPTDRTKVLVAVHDFYDSPHSFGDNFYPDFYIWLRRLGELSRQTNYDWYLKTHPDFRGKGPEVLASFVEEFPNFTILSSETSHLDIVRDGIDVALTVYGTIAMEYAAMGKPVVNASRYNPHVAYGFSITPQDVKGYEETVLNLDDLDFDPSLPDVLEYYYMHLLHPIPSWIISDFQAFRGLCGGYEGMMTDKAYDAYLKTFDQEHHQRVNSAVRRFIDSGHIRIDRRHFAEVPPITQR